MSLERVKNQPEEQPHHVNLKRFQIDVSASHRGNSEVMDLNEDGFVEQISAFVFQLMSSAWSFITALQDTSRLTPATKAHVELMLPLKFNVPFHMIKVHIDSYALLANHLTCHHIKIPTFLNVQP